MNKCLLLPAVMLVSLFSALVNAHAAQASTGYFLIENFEGGANAAGGASGTWTIDPSNKKIYCRSQIASMPGPENSRKALRLEYSVNFAGEAVNRFWLGLNDFDASGYDHIEFDIKGDAKAGFTETFRLEIKKFKDRDSKLFKLTGMQTVKGITSNWRRVSIPLAYFNGLYDKSNPEVWKDHGIAFRNLDELVIIFHKRGVTKRKGAVFIDNIAFVKKNIPIQTVFDSPPLPYRDKAYSVVEDKSFTKWYLVPSDKEKDGYRKEPCGLQDAFKIQLYLEEKPGYMLLCQKGEESYRLHINDRKKLGFAGEAEYKKYLMSRLGGFPKKTLVKKKFSTDDREFLIQIASDTWRFFNDITDTEHGLPLDTIALGSDTPLGKGSFIGDYTNITNIGIYLAAVVAARDFGFISREDAVARLRLTLKTVSKLERSRSGFLFNYYDTTWGARTDYFVSFVDSGWLAAGVYVAKNAFPDEIGETCSAILKKWDFGFFYDRVEQQMWHGYFENMGDYVNYHYGVLYAEPRLASFIAIGRGDVEEAHWFKMARTFPEGSKWVTQEPKGRTQKKFGRISYYGGWYEYKKFRYVPSWGGSMFEALMPALLIDESRFSPGALGPNAEAHVAVSMDYALKELKYPVWGMSPSSNPEGGYLEYGVKPLGIMGYNSGAVTPHASFLALEASPKEAVKNIRRMASGWDVYGEYGFYDALDPKTKKVAYKYLALDQGMILLALDNYLNGNAVRKRFESDEIFKKAAHLLKDENFFEINNNNGGRENGKGKIKN